MAKFLRSIFFVLILANLLVLAWSQGYLGTSEEGHEPQRIANQLTPEKLHVTELGPQAAVPPPTPLVEVCRLVGGLKIAEAQRLQAQGQADDKSADLKFVVKPQEAPSGFWVFIPPLANKTAADKKIAELKKLGVSDLFLMNDEGTDKLAISLGMFSSEQAANEFLHDLTKRGVKAARMQPHSKPAEKAELEARGPQGLLLKRLPELLAGSPEASVGECPGN
jgi:hypothetical protein